MKEVIIEKMNYISHVYRDPYCVCDLYELDGDLKRVMLLQDDTIQKAIYPILEENDIDCGFYGQHLCICVPYYKGENLSLWKQQKHSLLERIHICREILFQLISAQYSQALMNLCLDMNNITISKDHVTYFEHPNFSLFLHPIKTLGMPQRAAKMFLEILEEDPSIHKQNYLKNPKEYQQFAHRVIWKRYQSYDALMKDLTLLQHAFQAQQKTKKDWSKIILIACAVSGVVILLVFGFLEWQKQRSITYDGVQTIGTEDLSP